MNKILNKDEVDALLSGLDCGDALYNTPQKNTYIEYDFLTLHNRIIRGRFPVLEIINDRFAMLVTNKLSKLFNSRIKMYPIYIDVRKYGTFMRSLPMPMVIDMNEMGALQGKYSITMDSRLTFALTDIAFGGEGMQPYIDGRDITDIELIIARKTFDVMRECNTEAWSDIININNCNIGTETNPHFANITYPEDEAVVIAFEVEVNNAIGSLLLCIPWATIEPLKDILCKHIFTEDIKYKINGYIENIVTTNILSLPFELQFIAECNKITLEQLKNLQIGDILYFPEHISSYSKSKSVVDIPVVESTIQVNGYIRNTLKVQGFIKTINSKYSTNITKIINTHTQHITSKNIIINQRTYIKKIKQSIKKINEYLFELKYKLFDIMGYSYFSFLNKTHAKNLALYLRKEHVQTIAAILFFLDNEKVAKVIEKLPESNRADIILLLSRLQLSKTCILKLVDAHLRKNIKHINKCIKDFEVPSKANAIINNLDPQIKENILHELKEYNT